PSDLARDLVAPGDPDAENPRMDRGRPFPGQIARRVAKEHRRRTAARSLGPLEAYEFDFQNEKPDRNSTRARRRPRSRHAPLGLPFLEVYLSRGCPRRGGASRLIPRQPAGDVAS